jgi:hypothetical protein
MADVFDSNDINELINDDKLILSLILTHDVL